MQLWTIRDEQLKAMQAARMRAYEDETIAWLRRSFPECEHREEAALRGWVQRAVKNGGPFQYTKAEDVQAWLELMALLGEDFENDPRCAWARTLLSEFETGPRSRLQSAVNEARTRTRRRGSQWRK